MRCTLTLLALVAATGCAASAPSWRYRAEGSPGDGAAPLQVKSIANGAAEYVVVSAVFADPEASITRVVRASGSAPVRLDLGRVRLRRAGGEEVPISRVCVVDGSARCVDGAAARGQVEAIAPGEALRVRADFGPLEPLAGTVPNPDLAHLTLVDDGVLVGGRPAPVLVALERIERR